MADVAAGVPTGKDYTAYGMMVEGGSDISYTADVPPAEAVTEMEAVRAAIKAGEFEVPRNMDEPKNG